MEDQLLRLFLILLMVTVVQVLYGRSSQVDILERRVLRVWAQRVLRDPQAGQVILETQDQRVKAAQVRRVRRVQLARVQLVTQVVQDRQVLLVTLVQPDRQVIRVLLVQQATQVAQDQRV